MGHYSLHPITFEWDDVLESLFYLTIIVLIFLVLVCVLRYVDRTN